ncbi:hypothetical protein [uncultured Aquimarina sp.]|uniref:hypothetical protein n=1 Tax=uncultured Aquimarina sp. TaxID=575652 RepID=UPI0026167371|nr:hypothetical protein [uncultured Aquimarina sp.]
MIEELKILNGAFNICDEIVPFLMTSSDYTNRFCIRVHSFSLAEARKQMDYCLGLLMFDLRNKNECN